MYVMDAMLERNWYNCDFKIMTHARLGTSMTSLKVTRNKREWSKCDCVSATDLKATPYKHDLPKRECISVTGLIATPIKCDWPKCYYLSANG